MPWHWFNVSNPAANSVIVWLEGVPNVGGTTDYVFSVHGLFINHTHTSTRRYAVRTVLMRPDRSGYHEVGPTYMIFAIGPGQPLFLFSFEEPLIVTIGKGAYAPYPERLEIIAVDGAEPNVCIGVYVKGIVYNTNPPSVV
jgi:hypothetical protein